MQLRPICFLREYEDKVDLYINAYKYGYRTLKWRKKEKNSPIQEMELKSPYVTVSGLDEYGSYSFYLLNENGDRTYTYEVTLLSESLNDSIDKIKNYIASPNDSKYIDKVMEELKARARKNKKPFLFLLTEMFNEINNPADFELICYYQLFNVFERYENQLCVKLNKANSAFASIEYGAISNLIFNGDVDKILVYQINVDNGYKKLANIYANVDTISKKQIICKNNQLYYIELYSGNDMLIRMIHYQPTEEGTTYNWTIDPSIELANDDTIVDDSQISHLGVALTDDDKNRILLEKERINKNYIIPRPTVSPIYSGSTTIKVNIPDSNLLFATERAYTLTVRERDVLLNGGFDRKFQITKDFVEFNLYEHGIDGEAFYYIQDDDGTPVSKITCFGLYDGDIDDYEDKKRLMELYNYKNSIIREIEISAPSYVSGINNDLLNIIQDKDSTENNVFKYLICKIIKSNSYYNVRNKLISLILSQWMEQFQCDELFFPEGYAEYIRSLNCFDFQPKKEHYSLVVEHFKTGDELPVTEFFPSYNAAIRIDVSDYDYCWMYAIDQKTYKRSGYIYINNNGSKNTLRITNNINVEEI